MSHQEFTSLVLNHSDGLKPFAFSLTHDPDRARDLCQETLCKAFANREKYQPGTNVKAWLFTIMRNIFINDYRREQRKKQVMETVGYRQHKHSLGGDLHVSFREVQRSIHQLPSIFKTASLLYFEGYKYQEIAFALNEPLGTIKSRIHFARKHLQKQISL